MSAQAEPLARPPSGDSGVPFDSNHLDDLMEKAGIDVLIASSKHNLQYLLGGYRFFFFDYTDAIGLSRYLPLLVYPRGRPDCAAYVGNSMESWEHEHGRFWVPNLKMSSWGSVDAMGSAVDALRGLNGKPARIGVERSFLPADAEAALRDAMPDSEIVDAVAVLERLRAVKTPRELALLRQASEGVVDSMLAVIASNGPGTTTRELAEALRREEVQRGLVFEYCLVAAGASHNRAPSDQVWREGDVLSLDSGGNFGGYLGDLCRMAILGEPDAELEDVLAEIDAVQLAARQPVRDGAIGAEIYEAAEGVKSRSRHANAASFVAHGMGLISHEAPRLSSRAPVPYPGEDRGSPLKAGMVISIETTLRHPRRGFIKLEDTVAVTQTGFEAFGDHGRGWNRGNSAVRT